MTKLKSKITNSDKKLYNFLINTKKKIKDYNKSFLFIIYSKKTEDEKLF